MIRDTIKDFFKFLKKYNVVALAVSFMIAKNVSALTKSAVDNVLNPMFNPLFKKFDETTQLKTWKIKVWIFDISIGQLLSDLMEFLILGIIIVTMTNFAERLF